MFLYLLCVAFFSVLVIGAFWIKNKVTTFHLEAEELKKSYPESEKRSIKGKILQIKDFINWTENRPEIPIVRMLTREIRGQHILAGSIPITETYSLVVKNLEDHLFQFRYPAYLIAPDGKVLFYADPRKTQKDTLLRLQYAILRQLVQKGPSNQYLFTYQYDKDYPLADSLLTGAGCIGPIGNSGLRLAIVLTKTDFSGLLQKYVLDSICKLRFTENQYVFVNTFSGKALVTNGKLNKSPIDIDSSENTVWKSIFKVQKSAAVHQEGVFHTYRWQKLSTTDSSLKTSFFSYVPQWKWIIGTGFYEDDVLQLIDTKKKALYREMEMQIIFILLYLAVTWALCYVFITVLSRRIRQNIELFKSFFERAEQNISIDKDRVQFEEFASIAEGANRMVEKQRIAELALTESEINYRYLFVQNPAPMLIYELATLKLLMVNESFIKQYGYSQGEACSLALPDLYPEPEKEGITQLISSFKGYVYAGEWHHIKKDGTVISIEAFSQGLDFEGKSARIGVLFDITRRKQLEKTLIESKEKAEESDRLKTSFLRNISHEIRTPMNAISGFSSFLNDPGLDKDKRDNFLRIINHNCQRLLETITDIVNASSLELGEEKLYLSPVNINSLVRNSYVQLTEQAARKKITIEASYGLPDMEAEIVTDEVKLEKVLTNLLMNALKFTRKGKISFGYHVRKNFLEFFVKDTGIGISPDMLLVIFDQFRQVDENETPEYGGTGLGLSLSKGYVSMLGGRIWAKSQSENGSTFYFTIPLKRE